MAVTDFSLGLIYQRVMRGNDQKQAAMFSYLVDPEKPLKPR